MGMTPKLPSIRSDLPRALTPGLENEDYGTAAVGGREVREEATPTKRASGVGQEPGIDALDMEGMAALGEKPELVVTVKLAEANSAIEGILEAYDGFVEEHREGVDEGLVHPGIMEVEQLLELALEGRDIVHILRVPVGGSQEVSNKEVEHSRDEEDDC